MRDKAAELIKCSIFSTIPIYPICLFLWCNITVRCEYRWSQKWRPFLDMWKVKNSLYNFVLLGVMIITFFNTNLSVSEKCSMWHQMTYYSPIPFADTFGKYQARIHREKFINQFKTQYHIPTTNFLGVVSATSVPPKSIVNSTKYDCEKLYYGRLEFFIYII